MSNRVHMLMSTPPKYSVAQVLGFIWKEKRDPHRAHVHGGETKPRGAALPGEGLRLDYGSR